MFSKIKVETVNSIQLSAATGQLTAEAFINNGKFGGLNISTTANGNIAIKSAAEAKTLRDLISQALAHA